MEIYKQYLREAYSRVLDETLKDESITVLNQMENKTFYFSRIHQLFQDLYSVQRENKIRDLLQQVQQLKTNGRLQYDGPVQVECPKCSQKERAEDQKQNSGNYSSSKQNFHLLLKQNERLKKQIQQWQTKQFEQIKSLSKVNQANEAKAKKEISSLKSELEIVEEKYYKLQAQYQQKDNQVQKLILEGVEKSQGKDKLDRKIKELQKEKRSQSQVLQKLRTENLNLKESINMLEQSSREHSEKQIFYKEKISFFEKEINKIMEGSQIKLEEKAKSLEMKQEEEEKAKQRELRNLISTLTIKQLQIRSLLKQKGSLQTVNASIQKQLYQTKQYSDRTIQELRQAFNKERNEIERQLKKYRKGEKQALIEIKKMEIKDRNEGWEALEEANKLLSNEKTKLQNKLLKAENANKMMLQNYEHITKAFKQQKCLYDKKIQENDRKVEQMEKKEKNLLKRIQLLEEDYKNLQIQSRSKVEQYEERLVAFLQDLEETRKSESSVRKQYQTLQKQVNYEVKNSQNKKALSKENELNLRINQLQLFLQQSKYASKQLIQKKEEKVKIMRKQCQSLSERLLQANARLEKQQNERRRQQSKVKQLQKILKQEQSKIGAKEEFHRNQIIQLMRSNQLKREELVQQLTRHFNSSMKQSGGNEQKYVNQTFKQIQQEYKERIKNLEQDLQSYKERNDQLSKNNEQLSQKFEDQAAKYSIVSAKAQQIADRQKQVAEKLQKQKKREVYIVRSYQDRINKMKYLFREIKFQLCSQFLAANSLLKKELVETSKKVFRLSESYKKNFWELKINIQEKIASHLHEKEKKIEQLEKKGTNGAKLEFARQKQGLILSYEGKLKSKHLQMMTILAEKQFILEQVREKEQRASKKSKQIQGQYQKQMGKIQKLERSEIELKDIISKMEYKVDEAEKGAMVKQKQICRLLKLTEDLQTSIDRLETSHRIEIKEMRQKYRQQNQRLFGRYEKQFSKMISLNSKKMKEKGSLTSIGHIGSLIPTKGNEEDKVQKLKKQIQDQKRMIQQMESQKKF